jgi:hypothetical protein
MKLTRLFCCFFLLGLLLALTTATALAWPEDPPDRVTISGSGLKGEVAVTDKEILAALSLGAIEDFKRGSIAAPNVGKGYQITRYFYDASFNFGRLRYYPNSAGERGYVFFEDGPDLVGDQTQYNRRWFYATPQGDAAMQKLLANLGVLTPASSSQNSLPSAEAKDKVMDTLSTGAVSPLISENSQWPALGMMTLVTCALALAAGLIMLRRKSLTN